MQAGRLPGAGGVEIAWQVDGPEGEPWLILSNSLGTDRRMWTPQLAALTAARRVLRYDTRGHGQSDAGTPPYDFGQVTGDVLALCKALDIRRADFMGISLGGMTGLALAQRAPDLIGRLVCADARADAPPPYKAIWDANIGRLHANGLDALVEPTLERWFTPGFLADAANAATLDLVRDMIGATAPAGYEGAARLLQSLDLLGGLGGLHCDTLYVTGAADMAAPVAVMQDMADRTPGAALTVLPDAAHLSNLEQPAAFLDAVRGHLAL